MCGFVLAYAQTRDRLPDQALLDRMDTAIGHRGPDEHGQKRCDRAVMGHRRLAIIDLAGGQQPMCTSDGQVWIVFNGEIYNFRAVDVLNRFLPPATDSARNRSTCWNTRALYISHLN